MTVLPTVVTNWANPDTVSVTRGALVVDWGSTGSGCWVGTLLGSSVIAELGSLGVESRGTEIRKQISKDFILKLGYSCIKDIYESRRKKEPTFRNGRNAQKHEQMNMTRL